MNIIRTVIGLADVLARLESPIAAEQPGEMFEVVKNFVEYSKQHPHGTKAFTIDATAWSDGIGQRPMQTVHDLTSRR